MRFIRKNITTWNTAKSSRRMRHHTISFLLFILSIPFPLQLPAVFALLFPRGGLNAADAGRKPGSKMQSEADRKQVTKWTSSRGCARPRDYPKFSLH